jgi:alpha-tubulin suppressor-like RCC1 family protein
MRSTASITVIRGCEHGTAFLDVSGALWYVKVSGEVLCIAAKGVTDIQFGDRHALVLFDNGTVSVFATVWPEGIAEELVVSYKHDGQFGLGEGLPTGGLTPTALTDIVSIACGPSTSYAVTSTGDLYSVGDNTYAQLANSTRTYAASATRDLKVSGLFSLARSGVAHVTPGQNHVFVTLTDGTLVSYGSNMSFERGFHKDGDPLVAVEAEVAPLPAGLIRTTKARSVLIEPSGSVWHTGRMLGEQEKPPSGYHFSHSMKWRKVEGLDLQDICLDSTGSAIALSRSNEVLCCSSGSERKFGAWSSTRYHLYANRFHAEQIALTPHASFIRQNGEWHAAYELNPNTALTLRLEDVTYAYTPMVHPQDWFHVATMRNLGIHGESAIKAALALA